MKFLCDRFISPLGLYTVGAVCGALWRCRLPLCGVVGNGFSSPLCWLKHSYLNLWLKMTEAALGLSSSRFVVRLLALWNPGVWELGDQFCSSDLIVCWRNNGSSPGFLAHKSLLGLKGCAIPTTGVGFWPMTCPVANHFFLTLMAGNGTVTSALRRQSHSLEGEGSLGKRDGPTKIPSLCSESGEKGNTWYR